jgi:hypothetical protein
VREGEVRAFSPQNEYRKHLSDTHTYQGRALFQSVMGRSPKQNRNLFHQPIRDVGKIEAELDFS